MAYADETDKVVILISNVSKSAISNRPLSLTNLKDLGKLKEDIGWMKDNWESSTRIDEDYQIISDLSDKADSLTYSELKIGLEKIQNSRNDTITYI